MLKKLILFRIFFGLVLWPTAVADDYTPGIDPAQRDCLAMPTEQDENVLQHHKKLLAREVQGFVSHLDKLKLYMEWVSTNYPREEDALLTVIDLLGAYSSPISDTREKMLTLEAKIGLSLVKFSEQDVLLFMDYNSSAQGILDVLNNLKNYLNGLKEDLGETDSSFKIEINRRISNSKAVIESLKLLIGDAGKYANNFISCRDSLLPNLSTKEKEFVGPLKDRYKNLRLSKQRLTKSGEVDRLAILVEAAANPLTIEQLTATEVNAFNLILSGLQAKNMSKVGREWKKLLKHKARSDRSVNINQFINLLLHEAYLKKSPQVLYRANRVWVLEQKVVGLKKYLLNIRNIAKSCSHPNADVQVCEFNLSGEVKEDFEMARKHLKSSLIEFNNSYLSFYELAVDGAKKMGQFFSDYNEIFNFTRRTIKK